MRSGAKFDRENCERPHKRFVMTNTDLVQTFQPTALATYLQTAHPSCELAAYRGTLTPRRLDGPEREMAALTSGAAIHDLGWFRRVSVRGEDRERWLSGMLTNTVKDLAPNSGAYNLVLNAQGRIQGDLNAWRDGNDLDLEIAADQFDKLMEHLNHFIIMDDVELVPLGEEPVSEAGAETAVALIGPQADDVLRRLSLVPLAEPMTLAHVEWNGLDLRIARGYSPVTLRYRVWLPAAGVPLLWSALRTAGASPVGCEAAESFRVAEGIPAYGVDITERDLPQETSQMRALHFTKGCYLGQEIVERIRSRGNVHRHIRQVEITGPLPAAGEELLLEDGGAAGYITSAAELPLATGKRTFALAMLRAEGEAQQQPMRYAEGTAQILAGPPKL